MAMNCVLVIGAVGLLYSLGVAVFASDLSDTDIALNFAPSAGEEMIILCCCGSHSQHHSPILTHSPRPYEHTCFSFSPSPTSTPIGAPFVRKDSHSNKNV